ncbi:methylated-DNA--[protein]-cysteine S-methyltransferase [Frankia sp. Ag45/Mut15]|uniref:Methylated-DNA--[protein]-cysteine S-methyltransferase n=1 Tax=Frankia umida TaxID=573489 RepID=A0ABT0JZG8_9ACTN|nr:methylated-DNA--[protein]-cysteine S-methyltransferase [Frankia umida]
MHAGTRRPAHIRLDEAGLLDEVGPDAVGRVAGTGGGSARGFALFDTAIGRCGLAWGEAGLIAVSLPAGSDETTLALVHRHLRDRRGDSGETSNDRVSASGGFADLIQPGQGARPAEVAAAISRMAGLLAGARDDLADVRVDLGGVPAFHQRVYQVTRAIPPGSTLTYGEVAARLGMSGAAQAVGRALGRNPVPIVVPCHRVLASGGAMHGFSAPGGIETKHRMLVIEGALAPAPPTLF